MEKTIAIPTMLTIKETAKRTQLSETYVRNLVLNKKICFVRSGRKYLVNLEKLIEFLNTQE